MICSNTSRSLVPLLVSTSSVARLRGEVIYTIEGDVSPISQKEEEGADDLYSREVYCTFHDP
jgi:hypothetical protein